MNDMNYKALQKDSMKNNNGFTLIELVVAILVFALGIMGIMKMHSATVQANNYSMQVTEAVNAGENELEYLRGLEFAHDSMSIGVHNTTNLSRGIPYNLSWTVTNPGTAGSSRNVLLTVQWQEKALNHQINMEVTWDEL